MAVTRILLQGLTTLWSGPPRPWLPGNNITARNNLNSVEVVWNGTAVTTFPQPRNGFRMWGTTNLPPDANGAAIISVDVGTAGHRAGGGAGSNYNFAYRDNAGGTQLLPTNGVPFPSPAPFFQWPVVQNAPLDPNGAVWKPTFINSANFEMGLFQQVAAATGVSVSYIDFNVLWAGDSNAWIAIGISLLLPILLPILGDANLHHLNDNELAQLHWITKRAAHVAGETTFPSIVLHEEREKLISELSRPTYGV